MIFSVYAGHNTKLERLPVSLSFLDGLETADPKEIFLEDADKAFGDAVALGFAHIGRRVLDAEKGDLLLEVVCDELATVIVA